MGAEALAGSAVRRAWDHARTLRYALPVRLRPGLDWRAVCDQLVDFVRKERARPLRVDRAAALLAAPFAMVIGSALYLGLEAEPLAWPAPLLAAGAGAGALAAYRRYGLQALGRALAVLTFTGLGFALTDWRVDRLAGPRVEEREAPYLVEGWVERIDAASESRRRYTVRLVALDGSVEDLPKRVRATAPAGNARLGDRVRVRAVLSPPAGPPTPGGYDFARRAYFDQLGGSGYAVGPVEPAPDLIVPEAQRLSAWLTARRGELAARLEQAGGEGAGGVLAALVTGDRGEIAPDTTEALRVAGLGHILAISGMHLALIGGGAFFVLSWLVAAIDPLARRCNPRKVAAAGALLIALLYLIISGASTPTQRAFVMAAVAFGAILADRRALTLRGVAIAALIVLFLAPQSGVTPGFQMSFAASVALVASNDHFRRRALERPSLKEIGAIGVVRRFLVGLAVTSLIAGTATAPFAAYHFNRFAGLGYFANILAMPVFTLGVMPFAALAGALAPLGLDAVPAWISARSIELVAAIAEWTAAQPGAITRAPAAPPIALALTGAAFVVGAVLREGRWRVFVPLTLLAAIWWTAGPRPDVWVGENGGWLARADEGRWVGAIERGEGYGSELFLRRSGAEGAVVVAPGAGDDFRCDAAGCVGTIAGRRIAVAESWTAVLEDCVRADVVLTPGPPPPRVRARCEGVLLEARRGRGDRGATIDLTGARPALAAAGGDRRPWRRGA